METACLYMQTATSLKEDGILMSGLICIHMKQILFKAQITTSTLRLSNKSVIIIYYIFHFTFRVGRFKLALKNGETVEEFYENGELLNSRKPTIKASSAPAPPMPTTPVEAIVADA
jgi:hypothetical protein